MPSETSADPCERVYVQLGDGVPLVIPTDLAENRFDVGDSCECGTVWESWGLAIVHFGHLTYLMGIRVKVWSHSRGMIMGSRVRF